MRDKRIKIAVLAVLVLVAAGLLVRRPEPRSEEGLRGLIYALVEKRPSREVLVFDSLRKPLDPEVTDELLTKVLSRSFEGYRVQQVVTERKSPSITLLTATLVSPTGKSVTFAISGQDTPGGVGMTFPGIVLRSWHFAANPEGRRLTVSESNRAKQQGLRRDRADLERLGLTGFSGMTQRDSWDDLEARYARYAQEEP